MIVISQSRPLLYSKMNLLKEILKYTNIIQIKGSSRGSLDKKELLLALHTPMRSKRGAVCVKVQAEKDGAVGFATVSGVGDKASTVYLESGNLF